MAICVLGINHKTATLEVRERFTVAEHDYPAHLERLYQFPVVQSAVVISTCNRTEYYLSVPSIKAFQEQADDVLGFDSEANHVYLKTGQACAAHLFAVTAGVDSLVLGETQIQGQVKRAFDEASQFKQNGEMNKLFQMAFKTAKLVRSDTEIGRNPVSVAHCAVQLGRQIFGALDQQKVLVVGAGETAELLIRYLINHGTEDLTVANRTAENATKLARMFAASTLGFSAIASHLHEFDLVFTATASPDTLIKYEATLQALKTRKYKPMVMIDLSVPRDIDDRIAQLEDVFLYAVDDLQKVITENINRRASTIEEATRIIDAEAELLVQWIKRHRHHDLLKQYQNKVEHIKQSVLDRQLNQDLSEEQVKKLSTVAHQVSKKLSHDHISALRKIIESGNEDHIRLMAELFDLDMNDDA